MTRQEIQELRDQRVRVLKDADDILAKAREEKRDLSPEEEKKFDKIHEDGDKLLGRINREERQLEAMASIEEPTGRRSAPNPIPGGGNGRQVTGRITDYERGEALRAWMTAGNPETELRDEQRANAQRCGIDLNSKRITIRLSDTPMRATKYKGDGVWVPSDDDRRDWQQALEQRAPLTGLQSTTTTGGYTTADETMRALEVALLAFGGVRSVATTIRTTTGGPLPIPTTNDTANKGEIIGENTTSNELEMTFGQLVIDAWKYSSKYILASIEFLQDTSINANQFIGNALGDRIGRITNDHFSTGTGSSQPNGIVTAATSGVTSVADPPTYDNFVDLVHSIDPAYRANGKFMMHDATLKTVKKIKVLQYSGDATGVPLWAPSLTAGQPDTILGYSYVINQSMAQPGSSNKKVIFGDLSKYIVRDVKDVTLLRLDELFAVLGQVAFLALSRHDGDLLNAGTNPVKYMQQA